MGGRPTGHGSFSSLLSSSRLQASSAGSGSWPQTTLPTRTRSRPPGLAPPSSCSSSASLQVHSPFSLAEMKAKTPAVSDGQTTTTLQQPWCFNDHDSQQQPQHPQKTNNTNNTKK